MLAGLYSAATGMNAAAERHEIIARNLAHAAVPGFRRQLLVSQTFESAIDGAFQPPSGREAWGVATKGAVTDFGQGTLLRTDQPLDVAIDGSGFFAVRTPDGQVLYTRNGSFERSATGDLVTSEGYPVEGEGGAISIPPETPLNRITIGTDGSVSADGVQIGKLQLVDFADPTKLQPVGATMFAAKDLESSAATGRVVQGAREQANVSAVEELIAMLVGMRHYEASQRALRSIAETVGQNTNPQS